MKIYGTYVLQMAIDNLGNSPYLRIYLPANLRIKNFRAFLPKSTQTPPCINQKRFFTSKLTFSNRSNDAVSISKKMWLILKVQCTHRNSEGGRCSEVFFIFFLEILFHRTSNRCSWSLIDKVLVVWVTFWNEHGSLQRHCHCQDNDRKVYKAIQHKCGVF